jgi:hypothetical protein
MPGGMFIGTVSAPQPIPGFSTPMNIDVAKAFGTDGYQGYMLEDTYVDGSFSSVPDGVNSWRWTSCTGTFKWLMGGDVNATDGGDSSDPYVIIEICQETTTSTYNPWIFLDDIAIVIY